MQYIGKIDIENFSGISDKEILTDEVILTEKQREHILQRHPEVLQKYEKYFTDIVEKPDYILNDNSKENTALILKTIIEEDKSQNIIGRFYLVLRLAVEDDDINNKNSIITCFQISERRMQSYRKNGKILWQRLDKNE